jgi:hypothetical protein
VEAKKSKPAAKKAAANIEGAEEETEVKKTK